MKTSTDTTYRLHCGLAPFVTASGAILASYQLLADDGTAIASVTFETGQFPRIIACDGVDKHAFLKRAREALRGDPLSE